MICSSSRRAAMAHLCATADLSAAANPDPILEAIERHRLAIEEREARHGELLKPLDLDEETPPLAPAEWQHPLAHLARERYEAACATADAAAVHLARLQPVTLPGLAAAMNYLAEWLAGLEPGDYESDWVVENVQGDGFLFSAEFAQTLAKAAAELASPEAGD